MKTRLFLLSILVIAILPAAAYGSFLTMNSTQIQNLYEVYENPNHDGTYLNPVQATAEGAKFTGNVRTLDPGWGQIQIGANFWGIPWDGAAGDAMTVGDLGLGSLAGYDQFGLSIENGNENAWMYNLYFNVGYTDWGETNYYIQNTWTTIEVGSRQHMVLDFSYAQVWGGIYNGEWMDISTIAGLDLSHVSNIGFNIGGDVPVGPDDFTFETTVSSAIPEPATMVLFGLGMLGLGVARKIRK